MFFLASAGSAKLSWALRPGMHFSYYSVLSAMQPPNRNFPCYSMLLPCSAEFVRTIPCLVHAIQFEAATFRAVPC